MAESSWSIYILIDPVTQEARYVGKTHRQVPRVRFNRHISSARNNTTQTHCAHWIRTLLAANLLPLFTIIETGHGEGWEIAEKKWIAEYRHQGAPLTNLTAGGQGVPGVRNTEEARGRLRAALNRPEVKARQKANMAETNKRPDVRERRSNAKKALYADPQARLKQSIASKLSHSSLETREALRDAATTSWANDEIREKRVAGIQASFTPTVKDKMSAGRKAYWDAQTPQQRDAWCATAKEVQNRPETIEKKRAAMKASWERRRKAAATTATENVEQT